MLPEALPNVRTRFAPSPTGYLHLGGARTLLLTWLLARHAHGTFIFRLEDTDRKRLVRDAVRSMVDDITWLGLDIDEGPSLEDLHRAGYAWDGATGFRGDAGPYIQSLRLSRYQEVAAELIARGAAYRCDCSPARLEAERQTQQQRGEPLGYRGTCRARRVPAESPHVVRFRIPEGTSLGFDDAIRGRTLWNPVTLKDMVLLKTDGFPTYHLASITDDHDMCISHVLRGEEWFSTTPLHCLLYHALGWQMPVMAHLPVLLGEDRKKLSKRHGATYCQAFREAGYLPEALLNFLLLQGWAPGDNSNQEVFTRDEMIAQFTLERVHRAGAVCSYAKLQWMNGLYIRHTADDELTRRVQPFVREAGLQVDERQLRAIMPCIKERMPTSLKDALPLVDFLCDATMPQAVDAIQHLHSTREEAVLVVSATHAALAATASFDATTVEAVLRPLPERLRLSARVVFMTVRLATTGKQVTPPLFVSLALLGRDLVLQRLHDALEGLTTRPTGGG